MTNIEEQFFKTYGIGKPVIKKWYYDGYYEDFSWQSEEADCTELLKYFDNSIDKLNKRIQELKKDREKNKYDVLTDSVSTEFGRVSGAYIDYPKITDRILLELIRLITKINNKGLSVHSANLDDFKNNILKFYTSQKKYYSKKQVQQVQALFKEEG